MRTLGVAGWKESVGQEFAASTVGEVKRAVLVVEGYTGTMNSLSVAIAKRPPEVIEPPALLPE